MSNRTLMKALPIVAAALGKKHGIQVAIRSDIDTAMTNGKKIFLPVLPDTDEALVLARGYIDHESAHIRYTDFKVGMGKGLRKSLVNVLEDIRIEQQLGRELPGCRINLEALEEAFVKGGMYEEVTEKSHPASILIARIHHCLRVGVLQNLCTSDLASNAMQVFAKAFPPAMVQRIDELLAEADNLSDTAHVCDLADRIMNAIADENPQPQQPQSSCDCSDESQQQDQDLSSGSEGDDDDQDQNQKSSGSEGDDDDQDQNQKSSGSEGDDDDQDQNQKSSGSEGDDDDQDQNQKSSGSDGDDDDQDQNQKSSGSEGDDDDQDQNQKSSGSEGDDDDQDQNQKGSGSEGDDDDQDQNQKGSGSEGDDDDQDQNQKGSGSEGDDDDQYGQGSQSDSDSDDKGNAGDDTKEEEEEGEGTDSDTRDSGSDAGDQDEDEGQRSGSDSDTEEDGDAGDDSEDDEQGDEPDSDDDGSDADSAGDDQSNDADSTDAGQEDEAQDDDQGEGTQRQQENRQALLNSQDNEVVEQTDLGDKLKQMLGDLSFQAQCHGSNAGTFPQIRKARQGQGIDPSEASRETNALRTRLNGLIQASKLKRSPPRRVGSRIDTRSLHKLRTMDTRVFRGRETKQAVNTAVVVLIDQSSSMVRIKHNATKAAMAVALALDTIPGVKLSVAGFCSVENEHRSNYTPVVKPMKLFNQHIDKQSFVPNAEGGTPLAEGLWWAASELLSLNTVERRMVITVTDGDPDDFDQTRDIVEKMKNASIETRAIGIGVRVRPELIPSSCTISNISELPEQVFGMLQDMLIVHE